MVLRKLVLTLWVELLAEETDSSKIKFILFSVLIIDLFLLSTVSSEYCQNLLIDGQFPENGVNQQSNK